MTIKEIETLSGLTRANIRFYEAEGLLAPARGENGYRDYSESDLAVLKKIKLLRMLHMSLEEIKALQSGEAELADALDKHLEKLAVDREEIERSQKICREIRQECKGYQSLDAGRYLDAMEQDEEKKSEELGRDAMPRPFIPWRRFLARYLDWAVYETIWQIVLVGVLNQNLGNRSGIESLFDVVMGLILMTAIEPVLLSVCTTTFGKWILGIYVTDNEGRKLSYASALERTIKVLWFGMRLRLPVYELFSNYKCYLAYAKEETLEWEWDSELGVKDEAYWRIGAMVAGYVATVLLLIVGVSYGELPRNRGDITVAEFAENYNRYMNYLEKYPEYKLDSDGTWKKTTSDDVFYFYFGGEIPRPELVFTEENGFVTGISFEEHLEDYETLMSTYGSERIAAVMAFVLAEDGVDLGKREVKELVNMIQERPFESFSCEAYGVTIDCEIAYSGYELVDSQGMLLSEEGVDTEYSIRFSMQK